MRGFCEEVERTARQGEARNERLRRHVDVPKRSLSLRMQDAAHPAFGQGPQPERISIMKRKISLLMAAAAIVVAPAIALAAPPSGGQGATYSQAPTAPSAAPTTAPATPNSPTGNGGGYNHVNSPQHTTGQPMKSCETTGSPPGGSGSAPGSAFSGGTADSKYAGTQPQNSRNSASMSQYDVACANQPH